MDKVLNLDILSSRYSHSLNIIEALMAWVAHVEMLLSGWKSRSRQHNIRHTYVCNGGAHKETTKMHRKASKQARRNEKRNNNKAETTEVLYKHTRLYVLRN